MIAGRYTLIREIGRGGSGTVHLARDEVLGRTVAIKRIGLLPGGSSPDLARAEREARLAAALNHPHVVAVFDLLEVDDIHWLVMEYVDGETLAQHVRENGPMPARDAAAVLSQAADALADAHAAGIVHRDVKPSNLLLSDDLAAKLTDFGIARATGDLSLTQTGLVTGSPAYLAPEVASGASATPASDVWSLGATLFHAAAGKAPYDTTDNVMGTLYRIVNDPPPRLPAEHPLAPIVAVTVERDPAQRWPMDRVRDALGRAARGDTTGVVVEPSATISHDAPSPEPRGRRLPLGWIAAAVVTALIVVAAAWLWPGDGSRPDGVDDTPAATDSPTTTDSSAPSPGSDDAAAARQRMTDFITTYLETVTTDPRSAFEQLTPDFQEASGGYGQFRRWWSQVESATVSKVSANAANLTVGYTVDYVMANGTRRNGEQVILQLEQRDDTYLIAGEA